MLVLTKTKCEWLTTTTDAMHAFESMKMFVSGTGFLASAIFCFLGKNGSHFTLQNFKKCTFNSDWTRKEKSFTSLSSFLIWHKKLSWKYKTTQHPLHTTESSYHQKSFWVPWTLSKHRRQHKHIAYKTLKRQVSSEAVQKSLVYSCIVSLKEKTFRRQPQAVCCIGYRATQIKPHIQAKPNSDCYQYYSSAPPRHKQHVTELHPSRKHFEPATHFNKPL